MRNNQKQSRTWQTLNIWHALLESLYFFWLLWVKVERVSEKMEVLPAKDSPTGLNKNAIPLVRAQYNSCKSHPKFLKTINSKINHTTYWCWKMLCSGGRKFTLWYGRTRKISLLYKRNVHQNWSAQCKNCNNVLVEMFQSWHAGSALQEKSRHMPKLINDKKW